MPWYGTHTLKWPQVALLHQSNVQQGQKQRPRTKSDLCKTKQWTNPFQFSCLENPRDGGAWWAAVYGVAQSRTRQKRLSSSSIQQSERSYRNVNSVTFQNSPVATSCFPLNFLQELCCLFPAILVLLQLQLSCLLALLRTDQVHSSCRPLPSW